jgi:hypothetical protein
VYKGQQEYKGLLALKELLVRVEQQDLLDLKDIQDIQEIQDLKVQRVQLV